jgi:hypothetical protein
VETNQWCRSLGAGTPGTLYKHAPASASNSAQPQVRSCKSPPRKENKSQVSRFTYSPFVRYTSGVAFGFTTSFRKLFVIECKRCRRDAPAGTAEFPSLTIVVRCPLCGEKRRYRPSEVFLGCPNQLVAKRAQPEALESGKQAAARTADRLGQRREEKTPRPAQVGHWNLHL